MSVINVKVANLRKSEPRRENLREWMKDEENVYIGRAGIVFIDNVRFPKESSIWANPYKVGDKKGQYEREESLRLYENYIREKIKGSESMKEELLKLKGKNLGCWCKPEGCHGDILMKILEEYK
jgi:hypothetical protein